MLRYRIINKEILAIATGTEDRYRPEGSVGIKSERDLRLVMTKF